MLLNAAKAELLIDSMTGSVVCAALGHRPAASSQHDHHSRILRVEYIICLDSGVCDRIRHCRRANDLLRT